MAIQFDENGNPYDDGIDVGTGTSQTGQGGANAPNPPVNDSATIKNRTAQLRTLYWQYLFRLPTQDEFNGMALANGLLTDEDSWKRVKEAIPKSQAAELAMREVGGGKPNTRTVPSGYNFGSSTDYDPAATGQVTDDGGGGGGNNTQFFDASGKWKGGTDYVGYFNSLFPGGTVTAEQLKAKLPELQKAGINLHTNTGGDVIKLPDGSLVDVIRDVGGANARTWNAVSSGGGGTQSTASAASAASTAETPAQRAARLATFGLGPEGLQNQRPGEMPPQPTMGDMLGQQGPIADPGTYTPGEAYNAPDYMAPAPFAAPTAADMGQDPGYQFRLTEGQRALENANAAKGISRGGATLRGLLDYGQQAASQEYGNVYNRNLNTYNTNAQNAFQQYSTNALKNSAFNTETEGRRSGAFGTNTGLYQQQQTDAYNRRQKAYDDSVAAYQMRTSNQRNFERDRASDLFRVAGI